MLLLTSLAVIVRFVEPPAVGVVVLPEMTNFAAAPTVTFAVLVPLAAVHVFQTAITT